MWWIKSAKWTNALIGHFIQSKMWKSVSIIGFIQVIVPARVRKNIVLTHLCGQFCIYLTDANRYVFEWMFSSALKWTQKSYEIVSKSYRWIENICHNILDSGHKWVGRFLFFSVSLTDFRISENTSTIFYMSGHLGILVSRNDGVLVFLGSLSCV